MHTRHIGVIVICYFDPAHCLHNAYAWVLLVLRLLSSSRLSRHRTSRRYPHWSYHLGPAPAVADWRCRCSAPRGASRYCWNKNRETPLAVDICWYCVAPQYLIRFWIHEANTRPRLLPRRQHRWKHWYCLLLLHLIWPNHTTVPIIIISSRKNKVPLFISCSLTQPQTVHSDNVCSMIVRKTTI